MSGDIGSTATASPIDERRARAALARFRPRDDLVGRGVIGLVVAFSRWVMTKRNELCLEGLERFSELKTPEARQRRFAGQAPPGLLTFSNHVSLLDDPFLVSNFDLGGYNTVRWVAADAFNFFGDPFRGAFFSGGKCVPVVRGWGEEQLGFEFLRDRLRAGEWVHLFPEGGRTRDPDTRLRLPFKSGIGRLIDETRPITLPFYHQGMEKVLPIGARFPRRGHRVRVRFGDAGRCDAGFVERHAANLEGRPRWAALTRWAEGELAALEEQVRGPQERVSAAPWSESSRPIGPSTWPRGPAVPAPLPPSNVAQPSEHTL